jgi:hypothetical protein
MDGFLSRLESRSRSSMINMWERLSSREKSIMSSGFCSSQQLNQQVVRRKRAPKIDDIKTRLERTS